MSFEINVIREQNALASWRLSRFIFFENYYFSEDKNNCFANAQEWLELASNITKVDVEPDRFDSCLVYCGNAWHYEYERSIALTECTTDLTLFLYIWSAFESICRAYEVVSDSKHESTVRKAQAILNNCPEVLYADEKPILWLFQYELKHSTQFDEELKMHATSLPNLNCADASVGDAFF